MRFTKWAVTFTALFPLWAIVTCSIALIFPSSFHWFGLEYIPYSLGLIMLFMGLTIQIQDFLRIWKNPKLIFLGVSLQYTIMPISGYLISQVLNLNPEFSAGLILVASCPGGTASNVICYLGKLDVPLSVSLTLVSTILGVLFTPMLSTLLIGNKIEVDTLGLFISSLKIVVVPLVLGILISRYSGEFVKKIEFLLPVFSTVLIVLIVASIVGGAREVILASGWILGISVFTLHALGFLLGYILSKFFSKNTKLARTISIEVGMQNSGLGVSLAKENFTSSLVAVPPAISSFFHSIIASILIGIWKLFDKEGN